MVVLHAGVVSRACVKKVKHLYANFAHKSQYNGKEFPAKMTGSLADRKGTADRDWSD